MSFKDLLQHDTMLRNAGIIISTALFASQLLAISACNVEKTVQVPVLDTGVPFHCHAVPSLKLGDGYIHTKGIGAHKFHSDAQTWNQARKTCIKEGAHLAIINSEEEVKVLKGMYDKKNTTIVGTNRTDIVWLGAHDHFEEKDWVTVLGDSLDSTGFKKWNTGSCSKWGAQPDNGNNNPDGPQNCMAFVPECKALDDNWCNKTFAFFCEKPDGCFQDAKTFVRFDALTNNTKKSNPKRRKPY